MAEKIYPPVSQRERENAALARSAAAQSMVLLKNEGGLLPLSKGRIALFGGGAARTVRGGTGSGDPFNGGLSGGGSVNVDQSPRYHIHILDAFLEDGWEIATEPELRKYAEEYDSAKGTASTNPMATFAFPDEEVSAQRALELSKSCPVAVYVLSRNSGEGHDRVMLDGDIGDYQLSAREQSNLRNICAAFEKTVLVLNVGGIVDLSLPLELGVKSILLMSQAGQEGGLALADVISGRVCPSGKLTDTWAKKYSDYPASATFAKNDGDSLHEEYREGIYVGYRYFDAFGIEPFFPFGFGLSYTTFSYEPLGASLDGESLTVRVKVTNTGAREGREVIQLYCSAPDGALEMPVQELRAFAKTGTLAAGASETLTLTLGVRDLASYDAARGGFVLQRGSYILRAGTSSRDTLPVASLEVAEDTMTKLVGSFLPLPVDFKDISRKNATSYLPGGNTAGIPSLKLGKLACDPLPNYTERVTTYTKDKNYKAVMPYEDVCYIERDGVTFADVLSGSASYEELVAQLTDEDLSVLNCGSGWGVAGENSPIVGSNAKTIRGAAGETTSTLSRYGIPAIVLADGPAGIRVSQHYEARNIDTGNTEQIYNFCTAWPVGTLLAQSFDTDLIYKVGCAISREMQEIGVHLLLGPGLNIHRDPLCGRNFEYFSEDPLVSGKCAAAIINGVQSLPGAGACPKHFAANNQETDRNASDSLMSQRALREIYLRGFEIAVREGHPFSMMTSYNHVNSVPAGDSYELCTYFARDEWGFDGTIMTDWNGGCSTAWKSMHAGNDLIMPGGKARSDLIMLAVHPIGPEFDERGQVASFTTGPFPIPSLMWNAFTVSENGEDTVTAQIADGHTAEVSADGAILVDGEPVYTAVKDMRALFGMRNAEKPNFLDRPATTAFASLSEDRRSITYRGTMRRTPTICRGDLQRCAISNLRAIARGTLLGR